MEGGGLEDGKGVTAAADSGDPHLCSGSEGGESRTTQKDSEIRKKNKSIIPIHDDGIEIKRRLT